MKTTAFITTADAAPAMPVLRESPQYVARMAAEWLHEIADRLEATTGAPLATFDHIWPLLLVEQKVAELVRGTVCPKALREVEERFFGAPLPRIAH